jgi:hypothetical protein
MIILSISEEALADLDDGFWFYELQERGLGDYFASALKTEIEGRKRSDHLSCHRLPSGSRLDSGTSGHIRHGTLLDIWMVCRDGG